jgi:hypothetical protein
MVENFEGPRAIAADFAARAQRETVAVRAAFIASPTPAAPPPLTELLRGGRGGEVKVKLLLSMLWVAVKEPYDVVFPARAWAMLLGLEDPDQKGAARVNAAIRRLVEAGYLRAEKRPGQPSQLFLQNELGTRELYSHPGAAWEAVKDADARTRRRTPRYLRLPVELWTHGWIAALSGPAFAMLLILLEAARGNAPVDLWFAPSVAAARYGLNEATRKKGIDELEHFDLVTVKTALVVRDALSSKRRRNTFTVNVGVLDSYPVRSSKNDLRRLLDQPTVDDAGADDDVLYGTAPSFN